MEIDRPQFTDPIPSLISSDIIITTFFKYGLVSASRQGNSGRTELSQTIYEFTALSIS